MDFLSWLCLLLHLLTRRFSPFLSDQIIATGYGAYIAIPLLRNARGQNPNLTKNQARHVQIFLFFSLLFFDHLEPRSWRTQWGSSSTENAAQSIASSLQKLALVLSRLSTTTVLPSAHHIYSFSDGVLIHEPISLTTDWAIGVNLAECGSGWGRAGVSKDPEEKLESEK